MRKQLDQVIEGRKFEHVNEQLDAVKVAAIVGGIVGYPPLNADVCWGAVIDSNATELSLVCLDAKSFRTIPEQGALLIQRSETTWK